MAFLGGIFDNIKEFLSDCKEWHSAVIGFSEGFIPWYPEHLISKTLEEQVSGEYHYYVSAMVAGLIARIFTIAGAIVWGVTKIASLFLTPCSFGG